MITSLQVSLFTPVKTGNSLSSLPASYVDLLFCATKEIAVLNLNAENDRGCIRESHDTSFVMAAIKIATYILSAGILPLLAILANLVIRYSTTYYYIEQAPLPQSPIQRSDPLALFPLTNSLPALQPAEPIEELIGPSIYLPVEGSNFQEIGLYRMRIVKVEEEEEFLLPTRELIAQQYFAQANASLQSTEFDTDTIEEELV